MRTSEKKAPLYQALKALADGGGARFHMPGHKGNSVFSGFDAVFAIDYTEIFETGNLYEGTEPIRGAERLAAQLYGATDCHFLTGGSTQGVHAMLGAVCGDGGSVLLDRASHKSTVSACALFDLTPAFMYPEIAEPFGFTGEYDPKAVEQALQKNPQVSALMVVSPNYYGVVQDIKELAEICHQYGKKLLVDAAHGAHFPAVGLPSPIELGADAAVLSAHKTLPALGQGAYLIFADTIDRDTLRRMEAMVGTSSPSYPMMASLDLSRAWLENEGAGKYQRVARFTTHLQRYLNQCTALRVVCAQDFQTVDPCRLTLDATSIGMTGYELETLLWEKYQIACEMADSRCVVLIITGADKTEDLLRLTHVLRHFGKNSERKKNAVPVCKIPQATRACSVRKAWFSPCDTVALAQAKGEICARAVTPYPPGIPLLWPGEKITEAHIEFFQKRCYTNITHIKVIDKTKS